MDSHLVKILSATQLSIWQAIEGTGIILEVAMLAMLVWLVWDLVIPIRRKVGVVAMFGLRLLLVKRQLTLLSTHPLAYS